MKAVVVTSPGDLDQLAIADLPEPQPGPGEVLIAVAYCGLNWADRMFRIGTYPHPLTYPVVPGLEAAGVVRAVGAGVSRFRPGDRVVGFNEKGGGYAELVRVPQDWVIALPETMDFATAAAFPVQGLTAYHMLHTVGRVRPGQVVLIHAIGGGVGLFCTQLAVKAGARVLGTVGTPGKQHRALEFGAERVVLTSEADFAEMAMQATSGRGVDLVIDSLGAATLDRSYAITRKLGHIISIGEAEGKPFDNMWERLVPRSLTFTRLHVGHVDPASSDWAEGIAHVTAGIAEGWLRVPIEGVYPLEQARQMQARIEARGVSGKLLLAVNPDLAA